MSLKLKLRFIYPVLVGILWLTGCSSISGPSPPSQSSPQLKNIHKINGNYYLSGRILFKHPDGKHSGELELQFSSRSELRMSIFTPLIGSLIYELRASPKKFLLLNFQEKNYVLEDNNWEIRQTWLGMDISLTEIKWLILGKIPEKTPTWQRKKLPTGELQLIQGATEILLGLNSEGHIEYMSKSLHGLLEYHAKIPRYQKHHEIPFPRKIRIEDYTGNNHWLMVINEIQAPSGNIKSLDFIPPADMKHLISDQ